MLFSSIDTVAKHMLKGSAMASDVCEACFKQIQKIQSLNAFATLTKEKAKKQAAATDERLKRGELKGKLDGIPITVKDNFCTNGVLTTCGSKMLSNFVPPFDATVVSRLYSAGAVLVGKSNLDEFAMGSGTIDSIHGPTRNIWKSDIPYNLSHKRLAAGTCGENRKPPSNQEMQSAESAMASQDWYIAGGSSGGSAVAVATGSCFAAIGSDTGGSTRNPAAYCGVVGLKPSYGLVSRHGLIPLVNSMDVPGIMARSVQDVTHVLNVIAGPDPLDSTTVCREYTSVSLKGDFSVDGLRVGIPKEYICDGMAPEVVHVWKKTACLLEEGGAKVFQVSLPHTPVSVACYSVLNQAEVASNMARYDGLRFGLREEGSKSTEQLYAETRCKGFSEVVRSRIIAGNYFLLERNYDQYFTKALMVRNLIRRDFDVVWGDNIDILLTPTTLTSAPKFSAFQKDDNQTQCAIQDYCTQPVNMAGVPAISIPVGLSGEGLPLSLQLIAPMFMEDVLLLTAHWLEEAIDFPQLKTID